MDDEQHDSKKLWSRIHADLPNHDVKLGRAIAHTYISDPKMIAFIAARYKFVAKILDGMGKAFEVGCGDGFGAPMVAQSVGQLLCTDVLEESLNDSAKRLAYIANLKFKIFDFRTAPLPEKYDATFSVDVLEHIFAEEEDAFLGNIAASLNDRGVALIGTPNVEAEKYASKYSKIGHINLKNAKTLRATMQRYFHNVFMFSMNDEMVHTGYAPMAHYLWALAVGPRRNAG